MASPENAGILPGKDGGVRTSPSAPPSAKRICLIDLSGVFRQHWHASEQDGISAAYNRTLQAVSGFSAGFDAVGICIDSPPYKRSEMSAEYKAHREKAPAVMHEQMAKVIAQLDRDGYHVLGAKGYEADDVIATVCRWAEKDYRPIVVYSADKDMLQLVSQHVDVISSATGTVYAGEASVVAKMGVKPEQVADWLALVGDKSDGIPGVHGVGPKTAASWLTEFGNVEGVLMNADKLEPARFREAVAAGRDVIAKSFLLAHLMDDAPINPEVLLERKEPQREEVKDPEIIDEPEPEQTAAMVPVSNPAMAPVEFERALEPRDSGGALKLAKYLYESRMFGQFTTPEAVLAIILAGRAHGLGAFQALQGFHNIKGKPSASAQMIVGLVKRHPACKYFRLVAVDDEQAVYETLRHGEPEPTRLGYSFKQAQTAGLAGKDNWKNDRQAMLMARGSARLARAVYPDIVSGLYTPDEIEDG